VIAVDINLLVYTFDISSPHHERTRVWLERELTGGTPIAVPWETAMGCVRLISNERIYRHPMTVTDAWTRVGQLLADPRVWVPTPTPQHAQIVSELVGSPGLSSNDVPDVHLAALSISHGLRLASHDQGFARFEGLRWFDPIAA
jgi:hypothetical protein